MSEFREASATVTFDETVGKWSTYSADELALMKASVALEGPAWERAELVRNADHSVTATVWSGTRPVTDERVRVAAAAIAKDWNERMFQIRKGVQRKLRELGREKDADDFVPEPGSTTAQNWLTEARAALEAGGVR